MTNHHFISYSTKDAQEFALKLCDKLKSGPPSIPAWLDKRELKPDMDWDDQVVEAIRACESVIFVMSGDSVRKGSICKDEWSRALKYKKPVIPILFHKDAEPPLRLGNRQHIDFSGDIETGLAKLRLHLEWLSSQEGKLQSMRDRLADAERELQYENDDLKVTRIKDDIEGLEKQIDQQERIVSDPQGAAARVEESIRRGLERERQPMKPVSGITPTKFINPPPGAVPVYFQNRHVEIKLVGDFLKNEAERIIVVTGRAGIGKTAMVGRLLKALESGHLPDDGGALKVDGIVYLGESGVRKVNFLHLFADLCLLLPDDTSGRLKRLYKEPHISTADKMRELLSAFPQGRLIVLLDNFENKLDPETHDIADEELDEALKALLNFQHHAVKIIITTRITPRNLALVQPGRQYRLDLDQGLKSPFAENILREMDKDGKVGLKSAPEDLLDRARQRTLGNPRALEALFAILSADRETSLQDILDDTKKILPGYVVEQLVGEAFSRLDTPAQGVMQALAVYGRAVTPAAVDYLLQPFLPGVDSAPVLNRLVNMQLVRRDNKRYYLHPVDCEYALSRVPEGKESDRKGEPPLFTRFALLHHGADYFKKVRISREDWKNIDDLAPQLAEIDLRYSGRNFDTALQVLFDIDFDYLLLWGHYRLMADLHERFQGKISDPKLKEKSVGNLGSAYHRMGQYGKAFSFHEKALDSSRERNDRWDESVWLCNLGLDYTETGQTDRAIEYLKQSMSIMRDVGDRKREAIVLCNLGNQYVNIGQTGRAIEYYEQSLSINRDVGDRYGEAITLGNLGERYIDLGQTGRAIEYCEQSLVISREIGFRLMESGSLILMGDIFVQQDKLPEAVKHYSEAIGIADEIGNVQRQNEVRYGLALAYLYSGNLTEAHTVIGDACKYNYPFEMPNVLTLSGLIHLKLGDFEPAREAFTAAITEAEALLGYCGKNYRALNSKGLSLCGLVLCEKNQQHIQAAVKAFQSAQKINKDPGYMKGLLRMFDEMAKEDKEGVLTEVREYIKGVRR
jgi:tetratricopeptide (TPR) repeat protein